jgi:molybdopterin converting factor small subunit
VTARLLVPAPLRACAGGARELDCDGTTLREVLDDIGRRLPVLERRIRDERGVLRPHVNVYIDSVSVRGAGGLDTPVRDDSEVFIAPAVSGG